MLGDDVFETTMHEVRSRIKLCTYLPTPTGSFLIVGDDRC
jgi:hypothetical protein